MKNYRIFRGNRFDVWSGFEDIQTRDLIKKYPIKLLIGY